MSITLAATNTLQVQADAAASITYTIFGDEVSAAGVDAFKVLAQGQMPNAFAAAYTVPASTAAIIKNIHLVNPTGASHTAAIAVNGSAAGNYILAPTTILAGGSAVLADDGWRFYNANGELVTVGATGAQGDPGPTGPQGDPGGPMGPPGFDGPEGDGGDPGPMGPAGIAGAAGAAGSIGRDGFIGYDGQDGEDGMMGPPGPAGPAYVPPVSATIGVHAKWTSGAHGGTGSYIAVAFNGTDVFDTDGFHDPAVNNTRCTVPAGLGGKYLAGAHYYAGSDPGNTYAAFFINGVQHTPTAYGNSGDDAILGLTQVLDLAAGDYVEFRVNVGGTTISAADMFLVKMGAVNGSLTSTSATLSADVAMTTANTFYDGPSAALAAGTWMVWGKAGIAGAGSASQQHVVRLTNGTVHYAETEFSDQGAGNGYVQTGECFAIITLTETTTVKVQATAIRNGCTMKRNTTVNSGATNTASHLIAVRVA